MVDLNNLERGDLAIMKPHRQHRTGHSVARTQWGLMKGFAPYLTRLWTESCEWVHYPIPE